MNYSFLFLILLASSVYAQETIPYEQKFEGSLPLNWNLEGLWNYKTTEGVNNTGAIQAKDHSFLIYESTALSPQFTITGSSSLLVEFELVMGRFSDGKSSLIVLGNYGNGWIPLLGCSEDTSFHLTNYPSILKIKLPENTYSLNSDEWIPANGHMNFQKISLHLDSLSNHSQMQFKFLTKYYYGGLIFLDNFHITNSALTSIRKNDLNELKIYPNPAFEYINIESKMKISEISILNCLGLPVACSTTEENKSSINTSSFSPGIYYIRIKHLNSEIYTYSRFIVQEF